VSKTEAGNFLKESPGDFQTRAIGLASEYDAMLRSPAWALLREFQDVQVQGYLNALEAAETYEGFLQAKANMNAIRKAQASALFLLDEIRFGIEARKTAPPSDPGTSA
jgi:hypothetical protein